MSPRVYFCRRLTFPRNSKGKIGTGAANKRGVWKIRNFTANTSL